MTLADLEAQPLRWSLRPFTPEPTEFPTNRAWRAAVCGEREPALRLERYVERDFHGGRALTLVTRSRVPLDALLAAGPLRFRRGLQVHPRKSRGVTVMGYVMHLTCLSCWTWSSQVAGNLLLFAEEQTAVRTIAEVWAAEVQRSGGRGPSENSSHFALLHGPEHGVLLREVSACRLPLPGQDLTDYLTDRHICRASAVEWAKGTGDFTGGDVGGRRVDRGHAPRVAAWLLWKRKRESDPRREHAGRWMMVVRLGDAGDSPARNPLGVNASFGRGEWQGLEPFYPVSDCGRESPSSSSVLDQGQGRGFFVWPTFRCPCCALPEPGRCRQGWRATQVQVR